MRRGLRLCLIALALIVSWALAPPAWADAILGTAHDFTDNLNQSEAYLTTVAGSLCVVCHTPHGGSSTGLVWNHTLTANASLTFGDNQTTLAGTSLPTNLKTWQGTTKNCLSCHDGSVAIGSLIEGTALGTAVINAEHKIGTAGNIAGVHPVGVPYPDQANASYNGITSKAATAGFETTPTAAKLFGSTPGVTTAGQNGIECASCHNPHGTSYSKFLRLANSGTTSASYICLNCHKK